MIIVYFTLLHVQFKDWHIELKQFNVSMTTSNLTFERKGPIATFNSILQEHWIQKYKYSLLYIHQNPDIKLLINEWKNSVQRIDDIIKMI